MNSVTMSSVPMWTHALSLSDVATALAAASARVGRTKPSSSPLAPATPSLRNSRRSTDSAMLIVASGSLRIAPLPHFVISLLLEIGRAMDRASNRLVGAAAADVAAHGLVDVSVGRIWRAREQCGGGHDLAALAIAALRHVDLQPGLLHRMRPIGRQPLDRRHALARDIGDRDAARFHGPAVDVDRARAALGEAAAE